MSKSAVVLCLNGRRRTIKFAPNSTVAQIIEDVCMKENVDPSAYDLRTMRSILDRTLPWRFTNLPNNAKLELCPRSIENQLSNADVKIAFQLPDNQRLTGEFPTTTLLAEIVEHFSAHLQSVEKTSSEEIPSINYMRQKFVGNTVLASTSLQKLGIIKGSALLRFSYEPSSSDQTTSGKPTTSSDMAKQSNVEETPTVHNDPSSFNHEENATQKECLPSSTEKRNSNAENSKLHATPIAKLTPESRKKQKSPKSSPKSQRSHAPESISKLDIPIHDFDLDSPKLNAEKSKHAVTPKAKLSPKSPKKQKSSNSPKSPRSHAPQSSPSLDIPMHDSDSNSERRIKPPVLMDVHDAPPTSSDAKQQPLEERHAEKKVKRKKSTAKSVPLKRSKMETRSLNQTSSATNEFANFKFPSETKGADLQNRSQQVVIEESDLLTPCDRQVILFNESDHKDQASNSSVETDEFFEVTVDDLRKMMADLKQERKKLEEQEMLTEEQRKSQRLLLAAKYPALVIRIVLPDRFILQGFFRPLEKIHSLYDFVREHVNVHSFYLFTAPPKKILKDNNATLFDNNLAPAARVYFGTDGSPRLDNLIKESTSRLLRTIEDANQDLKRLKK